MLLFLIFLSNSHQSEYISFLFTCMNCICLSINSPVCQKNAAHLHEKFVVELPFTLPSSFLFVLMYSFFSPFLSSIKFFFHFPLWEYFFFFLPQHNKPFSLFLHSLNSQAKFNFSASRGTTLDLLKWKIFMCSEHVAPSYVPVFNIFLCGTISLLWSSSVFILGKITYSGKSWIKTGCSISVAFCLRTPFPFNSWLNPIRNMKSIFKS